MPLPNRCLRSLTLTVVVLICGLAKPVPAWSAEPLLVIHGGAGVERAALTPQSAQAIRTDLEKALRRGYAELAAGKPALDAVTAALTWLEDAPEFNAGRGAVFTHEGRNELDAAIMDGATLRAGAVAGVRTVKNPILLARAVMERSAHVLLAGRGAEAFARSVGIALVPSAYFRTEERWRQLQKKLVADRQHAAIAVDRHRGTVGAVAMDRAGHLAAGTSTGGLTDKRWGRIGDAPLIGAGTYANARCAVSGTGWGEFYIRSVAAHEICTRIAAGQTVAEAARGVINDDIPKLGGDGGAIVLGADGSFATPFNTDGMSRGWIGADGVPQVAIFGDEGGAPLSASMPAR